MFSTLSTDVSVGGCLPPMMPYVAGLLLAVVLVWSTVRKRRKRRIPDGIATEIPDGKEQPFSELSSLEKLMKMKVSRNIRLRKELKTMQSRFPEETADIRKLKAEIEELELQIRVYFRRIVLYQLDIQQKLADLGRSEPEKQFMEKVERIIYEKQGKVSWEKIYEMMPDGFIETLKGKQLNQTELQICCLHYYCVGYDEMTTVMKIAQNTLYSINHHIRKKLSICADGKISDALRRLT